MDAVTDPVIAFRSLWAAAREGVPETVGDAVALATSDAAGAPSVRIVLLRGCDASGFVFFTNTESRKGREALDGRRAALCFHWPHTKVQVRVEGRVEPVTPAEADAYFASRARDSQVGAWASDQSRPLASRFALLRKFVDFRRRFSGGPVPRPPHWSGFRVAPTSVEIWFDRPHRLHDRHLFEKTDAGWRRTLLNP